MSVVQPTAHLQKSIHGFHIPSPAASGDKRLVVLVVGLTFAAAWAKSRWTLESVNPSACLILSVEQGVVYLTNILGYSIPYLRGEWLSCLMVGVGEQE